MVEQAGVEQPNRGISGSLGRSSVTLDESANQMHLHKPDLISQPRGSGIARRSVYGYVEGWQRSGGHRLHDTSSVDGLISERRRKRIGNDSACKRVDGHRVYTTEQCVAPIGARTVV